MAVRPPALSSIPFGAHQGLAVDGAGNLYLADIANHRIRTVAGNGTAAFSGDGGPAFSASLNNPTDVAPIARVSLHHIASASASYPSALTESPGTAKKIMRSLSGL